MGDGRQRGNCWGPDAGRQEDGNAGVSGRTGAFPDRQAANQRAAERKQIARAWTSLSPNGPVADGDGFRRAAQKRAGERQGKREADVRTMHEQQTVWSPRSRAVSANGEDVGARDEQGSPKIGT